MDDDEVKEFERRMAVMNAAYERQRNRAMALSRENKLLRAALQDTTAALLRMEDWFANNAGLFGDRWKR